MKNNVKIEFLNYFIGYTLVYPIILYTALGDTLLTQLVISMITLMIGLYVFRKELKIDLVHFFKAIWKNILLIGLTVVVVIVLEVIITSLIDNLSLTSSSTSLNQISLLTALKSDKALFIILVIILGPINEELVFRKAMFQWLESKKLSPSLIILLSSLLFGFIHVFSQVIAGNIAELIYLIPYTIIGLGFGYITYKSKSVFSSIFAHIFYNLIALFLSV